MSSEAVLQSVGMNVSAEPRTLLLIGRSPVCQRLPGNSQVFGLRRGSDHRIVLAPKLRKGSYAGIDGVSLRLPGYSPDQPSRKALKLRFEEFYRQWPGAVERKNRKA